MLGFWCFKKKVNIMSFENNKTTSASLDRRDFLKAIGSAVVVASGTLGLGDVFAGKKNKAKPPLLLRTV